MVTDGARLAKNSNTFERKLMAVRSPLPAPHAIAVGFRCRRFSSLSRFCIELVRHFVHCVYLGSRDSEDTEPAPEDVAKRPLALVVPGAILVPGDVHRTPQQATEVLTTSWSDDR